MLDPTHDPSLRSWVQSANGSGDFPIQNLPHAVFRRRASGEGFRGGVAIGTCVLDLEAVLARGVLRGDEASLAAAAAQGRLNDFMALGRPAVMRLRAALSRLLRADAREAAGLQPCLVPQSDAEFALPAQVGDFTDFLTSWHHMVNAGRAFQPDAPPLENFQWLPIAYHGRASSVVVSDTPVRRPRGIRRPDADRPPEFGPTQRLDFELELGAWMGAGNPHGTPIPIERAGESVFGLTLLNDWSARDVQAFEGVPLGPFLAKNFMTSVSPWVVTLEALEPFRCAMPSETVDRPTLSHLWQDEPRAGYDIQLEVVLRTAAGGAREHSLTRTSFRHCHWSLAQMVAHHTEGGCNLRAGDLLGTGTQSGPGPGEQGCLLELTRAGREPVQLPWGESRRFLEDGDTVVMRAWAEAPGAARIGFGECVATMLPAP